MKSIFKDLSVAKILYNAQLPIRIYIKAYFVCPPVFDIFRKTLIALQSISYGIY